MTGRAALELDTLTIRIPIRLQRRGGRKLIVTPEGTPRTTLKPRRDETLVKALVRAHRWRRQIESGRAKSMTDLAEQESVTDASATTGRPGGAGRLGQRDCPARACPPAKKSRPLRQFGYLTPSTLPPEQQFRRSGGVGRHRDEPGALDETDLDRLRHGALNGGQNR